MAWQGRFVHGSAYARVFFMPETGWISAGGACQRHWLPERLPGMAVSMMAGPRPEARDHRGHDPASPLLPVSGTLVAGRRALQYIQGAMRSPAALSLRLAGCQRSLLDAFRQITGFTGLDGVRSDDCASVASRAGLSDRCCFDGDAELPVRSAAASARLQRLVTLNAPDKLHRRR